MRARTFTALKMTRLGTVVSGGLLSAAVGVTSAVAAPAALVSDVTPSPSVTPVRATAGTALAMTSPQLGELWIAERAGSGNVLLEHRYRGRWTSMTLPIAAGSVVALDSSSHDDVWLVAGGTLWHYDGGAWRRVALPARTPGGRSSAVSVKDVVGPDVFVGLSGAFPNGGAVYRLRGSRWSSLGNPETAAGLGAGATPVRVSIGGNKLFAVWSRFSSGTSYNSHAAYRYDSGTWTRLYTSNVNDHFATSRLGAWLTPTSTSQVALGTATNYGQESGLCLAWTGRAPGAGTMTACTTAAPVAAADLLADGHVLLGGADYVTTSYRDTATPVTAHGAFALRGADGSESAVSGDPGERTIAVETVPKTNSAWVLTTSLGKTTLQSFSG